MGRQGHANEEAVAGECSFLSTTPWSCAHYKRAGQTFSQTGLLVIDQVQSDLLFPTIAMATNVTSLKYSIYYSLISVFN